MNRATQKKRSFGDRHTGQNRPLDARVAVPQVRVVIGKGQYGYGERLADAHFVIRRSRYHYLRWREADKVREFYLGTVKQHATHADPPAPAPGRGPGAAAREKGVAR